MGGGKGGGGGRGPPRADLPPSASAVKEAKAAASRAHKEALAAGGFPKRLVTWARATVLETLNAPATRSTLLDAVHREGAHAPAFRELHALLERTVDGIENVSTLLVGPRGCGKHRLLSAVLRQMPTPDRGPEHEDEEEELAFHRVDLHALLVPDEPTALMAIASQLRVAHGGMTMRGSFCDGLRYLLHLLRRARPGCEGEGAVEAQGRPVLFVLHDFEQFTFRPKQTLVGFEAPTDLRPFLRFPTPFPPSLPSPPRSPPALLSPHSSLCSVSPPPSPLTPPLFPLLSPRLQLYSLFDLMQTEDAQMAVVGLTTRIDVADLLEKRVRSRCSQRQLLLPALTGADDCSRVLGAALSLPSLLTYSSAFAAKAKPFHTAWSANSAAVCASLATEAPQLTRRLSMGVTAGQLQTAVRLALLELSEQQPLVTVEKLETALRTLVLPRPETILVECSYVELLLLLCLKKLLDKELPPPHTFRLVLREYAGFLMADADGTRQFDYPRDLLTKAFEHLIALGLIAHAEPRPRGVANDQLPLQLAIDAEVIYEYVKGSQGLANAIRRFGTTVTL
jgi:hypothetical protein